MTPPDRRTFLASAAALATTAVVQAQPKDAKPLFAYVGTFSSPLKDTLPTQVDLPPGQKSGFAEAINLLQNVDGIGHVKFGHQHVVRHDLVRRIVQAYEESDIPHPGSGRGHV